MPELSVAPADSSISGAEKLLTLDFEHITVQSVADANEGKSPGVASATTTDLSTPTAPFVHVSGTTAIMSLGTSQAGSRRVVVFDDTLTLTHDGTDLILPTGADITTAAGDVATFISEGAGAWRCVGYMRANGTPLAGGGSAVSAPVVTESTTSLTATGANASNYTRFTNSSAKTYTFSDAETYSTGDEYHGRNVGAGDLTLTAGGAFTLNAPAGGTLVIPQGGTFSVKIVGAAEADVFGVTVAA